MLWNIIWPEQIWIKSPKGISIITTFIPSYPWTLTSGQLYYIPILRYKIEYNTSFEYNDSFRYIINIEKLKN